MISSPEMSDSDPQLKRIQDILQREPDFKNIRLET
jgi:hypothetical protein